jgi:hypothetical protein
VSFSKVDEVSSLLDGDEAEGMTPQAHGIKDGDVVRCKRRVL